MKAIPEKVENSIYDKTGYDYGAGKVGTWKRPSGSTKLDDDINKGFMEGAATILSVLDHIAGIIGLSGTLKRWSGETYTSVDFEKEFGKILAKARQKGADYIQKLEDYLMNINLGSASPTVKHLIEDYRNKVKTELKRAKTNAAIAEAAETKTRNLVNDFENQTMSMNWMKGTARDIEKSVDETISNYEKAAEPQKEEN